MKEQKLRSDIGETSTAFVQGDLGNAEELDRVADEARSAFGQIDALVNNAALTTRARIEETDAAFFDRIISVNTRAPLLLSRALLPELKRSKGCVLNIGSVLAHCGQANLLAYSVSKGGDDNDRNLADAHGPDGVRFNQLNVGWTLTENEYKVKIGDGLEDWPETSQLTPIHLADSSAPKKLPLLQYIGSVAKAFQYQAPLRNWNNTRLLRYTNHEGED